jgi:hypothetical protein
MLSSSFYPWPRSVKAKWFTSFQLISESFYGKIKKRYIMDIKVGDIYIRHFDGKICTVKKIDHKVIVLGSDDGSWLTLTDIYGLQKSYGKSESKSSQ